LLCPVGSWGGLQEAIVKNYRLPINAKAPGEARHLLRFMSSVGVSEPQLESACLLTTELVTNAVLHAELEDQAAIDLGVVVSADRLRIEVTDSGVGFNRSQTREREKAGFGHGFKLVNGLADRWGIQSTDSLCIWFELDRQSDTDTTHTAHAG
jgi:anti-sigma regulatory factor (Ser/Thr protein kinase)